jgi:hypothetical protein
MRSAITKEDLQSMSPVDRAIYACQNKAVVKLFTEVQSEER